VLAVIACLWLSHTQVGCDSIQNSMEFELDLVPDLFTNRDFGFTTFMSYLQQLGQQYPILQLKVTDIGSPNPYSEIHYDTSDFALAAQNVDIRFRFWTWPGNDSFKENEVSFKFISRLQTYALAAPMACNPSGEYTCAEKLEQDVHQNYSRHSHETKITGNPTPADNFTAEQFSAFFPGVVQFNGINDSSVLAPKLNRTLAWYYRISNIGVVVGGEQNIQTTIDFLYDNEEDRDNGTVTPSAVDLSIRLFGTSSCADGYSVHLIRRMEYLYYLILYGQWNAQRGAGNGDSSTWQGFWADI
jgi:hypothetical protein